MGIDETDGECERPSRTSTTWISTPGRTGVDAEPLHDCRRAPVAGPSTQVRVALDEDVGGHVRPPPQKPLHKSAVARAELEDSAIQRQRVEVLDGVEDDVVYIITVRLVRYTAVLVAGLEVVFRPPGVLLQLLRWWWWHPHFTRAVVEREASG